MRAGAGAAPPPARPSAPATAAGGSAARPACLPTPAEGPRPGSAPGKASRKSQVWREMGAGGGTGRSGGGGNRAAHRGFPGWKAAARSSAHLFRVSAHRCETGTASGRRREQKPPTQRASGPQTRPAPGATSARQPAGALKGAGGRGALAAAPAGLLTASRCYGGCSSGRRAAPARDSPRCSPSRSTAPGTAAAPPRPPSPAAAPGTGWASPSRTSSPPAAAQPGPPASAPGRRGARRPPPRRRERSGNFQGAETAKSFLSKAKWRKQPRQSEAGGTGPRLKATSLGAGPRPGRPSLARRWLGEAALGSRLHTILCDGEANPRGSGCGGVGRATYSPLSPSESRDCPLSPRREAVEPVRPSSAPCAAARAALQPLPRASPAAGRSQPHGGRRRGWHRAHTALPEAPQQIIPLSQAFIKLSHRRRREGKKKVKHTRCCWAWLSTSRAPSCCTLPSQV